ncbi:FmdB family zinc ribbon protein [Ancrocorticia populi]|uniref:FmdB family zinc ribbon protein n=1 Tax=Ancrocorticia populi TaxID=2175228 RepID=UPI00235795BA|nr:FmdB family zinc ribbon protein [Ancrocorticia populi]
MPTYSYRCTVCGNEFDVRQSFTDDALTVCENCGGTLRKLFNSVGIVFKGSGFYHNDSKSHASLNASSSTPSSSADSSSGDSAPTDSKPADSSSTSETKAAMAAPGRTA